MGTPKQIVAFCHFKGGVGTSFLASNVAYELAKNNILTCLIDFDTKLPNCANMLGLEISKDKSLYRYFSNNNPDRRGEFFINDKKLSPYLYLISSSNEDEVEILEDINDSGNDVNNLLNVVKDTFDVVIVDLPIDYMNPQVIGTIEKANKVMVIGDLDINTIENTFRSLEMYKSINIPLSKFVYIPNKYFENKDISLSTIHETLGIRVGPSIPFDYHSVLDSIVKSEPISGSNNAITDSIRKICSIITGDIAFEEKNVKEKNKKSNRDKIDFNEAKEEVAATKFTFVDDSEDKVQEKEGDEPDGNS